MSSTKIAGTRIPSTDKQGTCIPAHLKLQGFSGFIGEFSLHQSYALGFPGLLHRKFKRAGMQSSSTSCIDSVLLLHNDITFALYMQQPPHNSLDSLQNEKICFLFIFQSARYIRVVYGYSTQSHYFKIVASNWMCTIHPNCLDQTETSNGCSVSTRSVSISIGLLFRSTYLY